MQADRRFAMADQAARPVDHDQHHGQPEGRTAANVPVFNVSASLLKEHFPERPFRMVEIDKSGQMDWADRRTRGDRRSVERTEVTK